MKTDSQDILEFEDAEDLLSDIEQLHENIALYLLFGFFEEGQTQGEAMKMNELGQPEGTVNFNLVRDLVEEALPDSDIIAHNPDKLIDNEACLTHIRSILETATPDNNPFEIDFSDSKNEPIDMDLLTLFVGKCFLEIMELSNNADDEEEHVHHAGCSHGHQEPIVRDEPKIGRNDLCLCGSGKKYKKCCMA
jgi:hypothetical protein